MKIVHFIPILRKGGAERVVVDLANKAVEDGHGVSIVAWTPAPPELLGNLLRDEIDIRYLDPKGGRTRRAYLRLLPWVFRNREWLLGQDVVHCHLSMGSMFAAAVQLLRRLHGRRGPAVVETYHAVGVAIPSFDRSVHARLLSRRDAVAFMAEDPYWTRYRAKRPNRLFRTIPNGVATPPAVDPAVSERYRREESRIPDDAVVLGSVGRLVPERRPDLLLDMFVRLTKLTDRNVHLLLAGEGPVRGRLEEEARRNGVVDRVHMPGLILEPVAAFGSTDLYLTVNVGPITGIAALEAACSGVPVVALQLDQDYQTRSSDWIWSSPDPGRVAQHVAELLDKPAELKSLAAKQKAYARDNHSVDAMAKAYYRLYGEALAGRGIESAGRE